MSTNRVNPQVGRPTCPTCPACGNDNLCPGKCDGRSVIACVCGYMVDAAPNRETALKLPGLDRGRQQRQIHTTEAQLVEAIRIALRARGYCVLRIGQYRADWSGNDKGTPDMMFSRAGWPCGHWQVMEIKLPGAPVRAAQQALVDAGLSVIIRSVEEAMDLAAEVNERLSQRGDD